MNEISSSKTSNSSKASKGGDTKQKSTKNNFIVITLTVVVIPIVTNSISTLWSPTVPVIVCVAIGSIGFIALSERKYLMGTGGHQTFLSRRSLELIALGLTAMVLGATLAAISVIPIFPNVQLKPFESAGDFYHPIAANGYELLSIIPVLALTVISSYRLPDAMKQLVFLSSAVLGIALCYDFLRGSENNFITTFFGSLIFAIIGFFIFRSIPKMGKIIRSFIG